MNWTFGYSFGCGYVLLADRFWSPIPDGNAIIVIAAVLVAGGSVLPILSKALKI